MKNLDTRFLWVRWFLENWRRFWWKIKFNMRNRVPFIGFVIYRLIRYGPRWLAARTAISIRRRVVQTPPHLIIVCGTFRSGTTWLSEILLTLPKTVPCFEPLGNKPISLFQYNWGAWDFIYMPPDPRISHPALEEYLLTIFKGEEIYNTWTKSQGMFRSVCKIATYRNLLIKFCRANRLLYWMTQKFSLPTPILILRHPCSVVASLWRKGWDNHGRMGEYPEELRNNPSIAFWLQKKDLTWLERLTLHWCLDTYIPLTQPRPHPWHLVIYEQLVLYPEKILPELFNVLGFEMPWDVLKRVRRPSATVEPDKVAFEGTTLTSWRKVLKPYEAKGIFEMAASFGLDFYREDRLEPDYNHPLLRQTS